MKRYTITVNGKQYDVVVEENNSGVAPVAIAPIATVPVATIAPVATAPVAAEVATPAPVAGPSGNAGSISIDAPMPGSIIDVKVNVGDSVSASTVVAILEAMKMENDIVAGVDGVVASVNVSKGDSISAGDVIVTLQ